ncbi:MAG: acyltransferase [Gemmatimonadetes bacterium]|nr:acyltransferase [Gemmatimonadota bacterium]
MTSSTPTPTASSGRYLALDGLRAIAILLVLVSHLQGTPGFPSMPQGFWHLGNLGNLGVRIFFVLSGFIITHLLLREEARTGRASPRPSTDGAVPDPAAAPRLHGGHARLAVAVRREFRHLPVDPDPVFSGKRRNRWHLDARAPLVARGGRTVLPAVARSAGRSGAAWGERDCGTGDVRVARRAPGPDAG